MTEALKERGLTSKGDRRYAPQPLVRSKVHNMLRNPYYVGMVRYNGVLYPGRHEPLIDQALFDEVQTVLDDRKGTEKPVKRTHYLKGILACGYCRRRLGLGWSSSKTGVKYPYFFCLGRRARNSNGCTLPYLPMEQVEAKIEEYWTRVSIGSEQIESIRVGVIDLIRLAAEHHQGELDSQRLRLERLDSEEQKLLAAHYADAVSLSLLQREQRRIAGDRANSEGVIAALSMEARAMEHTLEEALSRIERCDEVYRTGSTKVRRELCFALFNRIYLCEEGVVSSELATPYAQILDPDLPERLEADKAVIAEGRLRDLLTGDAGEAPEVEDDERPDHGGRGVSDSSWGSNLNLLVGEGGLEPPRPFGHWNLNPARLPIPPLARVAGPT